MKRAVILGGRGQSGRAIAERLIRGGWEVTSTTAGPLPDPADTPDLRWVSLDRDRTDELSGVVVEGTDVVVDVTAYTPRQARQLIALGDRVGSAVVLSTLSVYTDAEGRS